MRHTAYIGLGSNMGDRKQNLFHALKCMKQQGIVVEALSSVYETEPQGLADQSWFFNMAARIGTTESPGELLKTLQAVEKQMGRVRSVRWGPRIIDIDILLYDNQTVREPDLEIPHPRLTDRAFVLIPLLEMGRDLALPDGTFLREYLTNKVKKQKVRLVAVS